MSRDLRRSWRALRSLAVCATLLGAALVLPQAPAQAVDDPCGATGNKITCENSKPGTSKTVWDITGAGSQDIQGFSTDISVNVGQRIDFKIDTSASAYTIDIYRSGWYGGDGARKVTSITPSVSLPQHQPNCISDVATELYDCGNWAVSASWNVPSTAVSGVYLAHLKRADTGGESHITFIVRDDSSHSDVVFQTSDTTWQAYNTYGGSDFYQGADNGRAYKISYNRPVVTRGDNAGRDFYMANEYPLVRFLERNGYDVSYLAGVDTDRRGQLLTNHKVFLSVGHDEYWSGNQRANVKAARDAGVNLQFLSGNEMYWRTRYEPSADSSHTAYRTLVSYKETWSNAKIDPSAEWTGTWRDPRYASPANGGGSPENALIGTMYMSNFSDLPITVSAQEGKLRLWRNTSLANLTSGSAALAPHTVGYESNEDVDNGFGPPGLIHLSTTTGAVPQYLQDFGNTVAPGQTTHHLTMYRANSGALVFSAGSIQWTWGLDEEHDSEYAPVAADPRMQQAQVNLLADMGALPKSLQAGLVAAVASADTTKPTVTVTAPVADAVIGNGTKVTVTGTAADAGGKVAAVEVSTDDGETWSTASGTTSWSHSYIQTGNGPRAIRVRAIDDSLNATVPVVRSVTAKCPCSLFGQTVPVNPSTQESGALELGTRFTPSADGFVTGIRFYKGAGNSGQHVGTLWGPAGQQLARVTFTNETATGWQQATLSTPVEVEAGKRYVASYSAPNGVYASESYAFISRGHDAAPLLIEGGYGSDPAGVYGQVGSLPTQSHQYANYYADVLFATDDNSPLIAMNQTPLPDSSSVSPATEVSARFSKSVQSGSVSVVLRDPAGVAVAGVTSYDASTRTVKLKPNQPLANFVKYTATVSGTDNSGNTVTTGKTWSFTTAKPPSVPGVCPCTLFDDTATPSRLEADDPGPVTLGVKFRSDVRGTVSAVRFYKGPNNTGAHTGALWTVGGTPLAEGTFTGESTMGWQTLTFAQPVPISKDTTYVASYRAPSGHWSADMDRFATGGLDRSALHVAQNGGAYTYGAGFPDSSSPHSYLVDVVFDKADPAIAVARQDPAPGAIEVPRGTAIDITFTEAIATSGYTMAVTTGTGAATQAIGGTTTLSEDHKTLTFKPSALLPATTQVRVAVSGVTSWEGASLAPQAWTFTTRSTDDPLAQSLFSDELPRFASADDAAPTELGTVFRPSRAGRVTAIRFFKGTGNLGQHTGSLWSSSGQRLATVTFTNETAAGWQTAALSTPVVVTAGTSYVVSYFAPQGHYSYTFDFFNQAFSKGSLTAPAGANGVYLYAVGGGFPQYSYRSTNYFVDVVFVPDDTTLNIRSRTPGNGEQGVARNVKPSITFDSSLKPGWSMVLRSGANDVAGTAAISDDRKTLTFTPTSLLSADTAYEVVLAGVTSEEGGVLAQTPWTFRTLAAGSTNSVSLFASDTPASPAVSDGNALELGVAFTSSVAGEVTAVKFWKGEGNGGTHTGSIWDDAGNLLATVTFANETASGWQTAVLSNPLPLVAGRTYVVSYFSPTGVFAISPGYFTGPRTSGPLTASAANGRFRYGAGGSYPNTVSGNGASYFVDLVFRYQG